MGVTEILIGLGGVAFGRVVDLSIGGDDGCAVVEIQADIALEMNGGAKILPGGEMHRAAALIAGGIDGAVDGDAVERFAVAGCAKGTNVE